MRWRGLVASCLLVACVEPRQPPATTTVDTRLDAAAAATPPIVEEPPPTTAPTAPKALGTCDDAIADAKKKSDMGWKEDGRELDVDGDGTPECVLRGCYSSNCELVIYRRESGGVRRIAEMTVSFVSHPHCVNEPPPGKYCRLEAGVHMIHGETQEIFYEYARGAYFEAGHGKLIPGPP